MNLRKTKCGLSEKLMYQRHKFLQVARFILAGSSLFLSKMIPLILGELLAINSKSIEVMLKSYQIM